VDFNQSQHASDFAVDESKNVRILIFKAESWDLLVEPHSDPALFRFLVLQWCENCRKPKVLFFATNYWFAVHAKIDKIFTVMQRHEDLILCDNSPESNENQMSLNLLKKYIVVWLASVVHFHRRSWHRVIHHFSVSTGWRTKPLCDMQMAKLFILDAPR
jgi:hypothetical protein